MKNIFKFFSIIFLLIVLDQISKGILIYMISNQVPLFSNAWDLIPVPYMMNQVTNFFNIVFTWNFGTSFSFFRSLGESYQFIIIFITGLIIGFMFHYFFFKAKSYERVPLMFIIGGALGNLIDRIRFGAVVDFLDFHFGGLHWPAFNFADICISFGIFLYILNLIINRKK